MKSLILDFRLSHLKPMVINFRPTVYMRHRTHSYLWLRDSKSHGFFLTMESGNIEVVKAVKTEEGYSINGWKLEPRMDIDFFKGLMIYAQSALLKSPMAISEMSFLTTGKRQLNEPQPEEKPKAKKKKRSSSKAGSSSSSYSLKDMADELEMEPGVIRRKLRQLGIDKPGGKWLWPSRDANLIARLRA